MNLFSERKKLEESYYDWISKNNAKDRPFNVISYLESIGRLKDKFEMEADKWIPCEERLPSEQNQYLVSLEGYCKPMIAYFSTENKKWYWYNSTAKMRYVIAWQPLPQPYKKEGESDAVG